MIFLKRILLLLILTPLFDSVQSQIIFKESKSNRVFSDFDNKLIGFSNGDAEFFDIDNDGDVDIIASGNHYGDEVKTVLYKNEGGYNFIPENTNRFPALINSKVASIDINNDDHLDIILSGLENDIPVAAAYINDGQGNFSELQDFFEVALVDGDFQITDIDNNGLEDLIYFGRSASGSFSSYKYILNGSNGRQAILTTEITPLINASAQVFDVDNDGDEDFVTAGMDDASQTVMKLYLNDGQGNYTNSSFKFNPLTNPVLGVGFVNSDTLVDIVLSGVDNLNRRKTYYYINQGNTDFISVDLKSNVNEDISVDGVADFNDDGFIDFFSLSEKAVFFNDGVPNFSKSSEVILPQQSQRILLQDLNGDGNTDLIVHGESFPILLLYENSETNSLKRVTNSHFEAVLSGDIEIADFNNDQILDILYTGANIGNKMKTKLLASAGSQGIYEDTFFEEEYGVTVGDISVGDLNGDELQDFFVFGSNFEFDDKISIYLNAGSNGFNQLQSPSFVRMVNGKSQISDIDKDNDLDIIVMGRPVSNNSDEIFKKYLNNGSGGFTVGPNDQVTPLGIPSDLYLSDINSDSYEDLISAGLITTGLYGTGAYLNDSSGAFLDYPGGFFSTYDFGSIAVGDLDGDSHADIVSIGRFINDSTGMVINYGNGSGDFVSKSIPEVKGIRSPTIKLYDIDADTDLDVIAYGRQFDSSYDLIVYRNYGRGRFSEVFITELQDLIISNLASGDFDGDGISDLFIQGRLKNGDYVNQILLNKTQYQNNAPAIEILTSELEMTENDRNPIFDVNANDGNGGVNDISVFYSILDSLDGNLFVIDSLGLLSASDTIDYETPTDSNGDGRYEVPIEIRDSFGGATTTILKISINDINDEQPVIDSSVQLNLNENAELGAFAGTLKAFDKDSNTAFSDWTLVDAQPLNLFEVDSITGNVYLSDGSDLLDYEFIQSFVLSVSVSDGSNKSKVSEVSLKINDLNDEIPVIVDSVYRIPENSPDTAFIGNIIAIDRDTLTTFQNWTIQEEELQNLFLVDSIGRLYCIDGKMLDHESENIYRLTATVSDGFNVSNNQTTTTAVEIVDVNEPPISDVFYFSVDIASEQGTIVGQVIATDQDNDVLTYNLLDYEHAFSVTESGFLLVKDFESFKFNIGDTIELGIDIKDPEELSTTATVFIYVEGLLSTKTYSDYKIFPNPAAEILKIQFFDEKYQLYIINILDQSGRTVSSLEVTKQELENGLNVKSFSKGSYIIIVSAEGDFRMIDKFYVE